MSTDYKESNINYRESRDIFKISEAIDREQYIVAHYRCVPTKGFTLNQAAAHVSIITTLRTLVHLPYESREQRLSQAGLISHADRHSGQVTIAYPLDICSINEGLTQLLVIISSGVEYYYTDEFWIDDIELPRSFLQRYQGPRYGIEGIRNTFKVPSRPLIGVVAKPRVGVPLEKIAALCGESLLGGVDFIADDPLMIDPPGDLGFAKRVPVLAEVARQASSKTGELKWYVANISTSFKHAVEHVKVAKNIEGVGALLVNAFAMGFATVEDLINEADVNLPIITSNMGVGLLTRPGLSASTGKSTGVSEAVISKLSRIAGADAVHAGTSSSECYAQDVWGPAVFALRGELHNIRRSFAVAEGDLTVANVWDNINSSGPDLMLEPCSSILAYPRGAAKGAEAFRKLVENLHHDMSPEEAHEKIKELASRDSNLKQGLSYYKYEPPKPQME